MANRIAGLDIGTYTLKVAVVELQRQPQVVAYHEVPLYEGSTEGGEPGTDGSVVDAPWEQPPAEGQGPTAWGDEGPPPTEDPVPGGGPQEQAGEKAGAAKEEEVPLSEPGLAEVERPWSMALSRLKEEGLFEGVHQVITTLPGTKAVTLHQEVPFEKEREIAEILPHILMDELPLSVDKVVYDFMVVPGKEPGLWEALIGIVEREEMGEFLGHCRRGGVDPASVGVPELMLRYAGDQGVSPGVASYGIIDIGHQFTRLLIMADGKPVVAHATRRGGAQVTEALSENFQISLEDARRLKHAEGVVGQAARGGDRRVQKLRGTIEEALRPVVRDLRRTFQSAYANYGVAVDAVYVCGGTSRLRGIEDFLEGEFDVPVRSLDLGTVQWQAGMGYGQTPPEGVMAVATALQRFAEETSTRVIDFRQDEFVYRGKSSYLRTQLVRLGMIAAVLFVMLAGVLVIQYQDRQAQRSAMQVALAQETQELFGEPVTSLPDVQDRLMGEVASPREFVPQMSAYEQFVRVMEQISEEIPLKLDRIHVDTDRSLIQIDGQTDAPQSVDRLAREVEGLDCLSDVSKDQVNVRGDEVQFQLQIASECS